MLHLDNSTTALYDLREVFLVVFVLLSRGSRLVEFDALGLVFRWLHILPATVVVGGTLFMVRALLPATDVLPEDQRERLSQALRSKWAKMLHASMALLIVSGLYNVATITKANELPGYYHPLFGVKFLLALVIFYVAIMLSGRSGTAQRMQRNVRFWLSLNAGLIVVLVLISGVLRMAERSPISEESSRPASRAEQE